MKNRSPRDNTISGIAENIAELDTLPGMLTDKQGKIDSAATSLNELSAVELDFANNQIPFSNRKITAISARIKMLELPVTISAIKELVKVDEATLADALKLRLDNEKNVQPYLDERKKIKTAIDLHDNLSSYKSLLARAKADLQDERAELTRLQGKIVDLKRRRESAGAVEVASMAQLNRYEQELQDLRAQHRAKERPVIDHVNQIDARLAQLKESFKLASRCEADALRQQQDQQKSQRWNQERARQAYEDKSRLLANAEAAYTNKRGLISQLESERRAYEAAKQTAAYTSGPGSNSSSSDAAPPSTTANTMTIPVGLGGFVTVPVMPSSQGGYSSSQGGYSSSQSGGYSSSQGGGYSSSQANNSPTPAPAANGPDHNAILARHLQKIAELERGIQSAEDEAKRFERKAASEHADACNFETKAKEAFQQAANYTDQVRAYAQQLSTLQTDIEHTKSNLTSESARLQLIQQQNRQEDDNLTRQRTAAYNEHARDAGNYNDLNSKVASTAQKIDETNQSILYLTGDIESKTNWIEVTEKAIEDNEYANQYSRETLEKMDKVQANLAAPYLKKIDECHSITRNTTAEKRSKEGEIDALDARLRAATATIENSKPEFQTICAETNVSGLQEQLEAAKRENEGLQQRLKIQRDRVRSKQSELSGLRSERDMDVKRQRDLRGSDLLMRLYENPSEQLKLLHADLVNTIKEYAETHHSDLCWQTYASLLTLVQRANFIFVNDNVDGETDNDKQRTRFYQLSGLLRHEAEFVNNDVSYRNVLLSLLKNRVVEQNDVLRKFDELAANSQQQLRNMTEAEVLHHEVDEYNRAKQDFDDLVALGPLYNDRKWKNFYASGKRISVCLHEQQTRVRKPGEPVFDMHLHTRIFQLSRVVLQHPDDALARAELQTLTQHNKIGEPSTARKVIGAILSFIGAAAALVGGLALAGLVPGISLPIAAPMIAVGGAGVIVGMFTFFSGLQRGLSKSYDKFERLAVEIGSDMQVNPVRDDSGTPSEYYDPPVPSAPSLNAMK